MMKTLGIVVFLCILYIGIFGININKNDFKLKCKPFIKEWIASDKPEELKENIDEVLSTGKDKIDEVSEKVENTINQ